MAWSVTAVLSRFDEAVDWFRSRLPVTDEQFESLSADDKRLAYRVAGATQLRVVQTLHEEIAGALESGEGYDTWAARVKSKLRGDWTKAQSARLLTNFRTNVQTALNTGRWSQVQDSEVTALRPFLMYDAVLDSRTTEICRALDPPGGPPTIRPHDDPFWLSHTPPLHFNCRGGLRSLRASTAEELGVTDPADLPEPEIDPGFGLAPPVREAWGPERGDFDPELWRIYEAKQRELEEGT